MKFSVGRNDFLKALNTVSNKIEQICARVERADLINEKFCLNFANCCL